MHLGARASHERTSSNGSPESEGAGPADCALDQHAADRRHQPMRIAHLLAGLALGAVITTAAQAQDTTHKPGGLNKVAHDVSKTAKKAGRDTKAEAKRDASKTHHALKKAGNDTKSTLKTATGDTMPKDPNHKPGGVNKVARDVSHASKETGAKVKHGVKHTASAAHKAAKKTGRDAKEAVRDTTH